jgi:predicted alpha-1,6-mannanase (GH76 family)
MWQERADRAQDVLRERYLNRRPWQGWPGVFRSADPAGLADRTRLNYWWQAHALDALVDAQLRNPDDEGLHRIRSLVAGVRRANRGTLVNDYYDDMAWMALALLRADAVGAGTAPDARALRDVLAAGWNDSRGGGIPWRRSQPDYKNVPANGPTAILAARLHRRDGDPADLELASRITRWMDGTLVDPGTHLVWDGVGRLGDDGVDGAAGPDGGWIFTYTHGVVIGAHDELHALTGDPRHAVRVAQTVAVVVRHLAPGGVLADEGSGDGALFRGILARYLAQAVASGTVGAAAPEVVALLVRSGEAAWAARDEVGRFGGELSAHVSGVLLVECLALLERGGHLAGSGG